VLCNRENNIMVVRIAGTITNLDVLEKEITKSINSYKDGPITVDLQDVNFMVSSATAQIVKLYKYAKKKGAEFKVINVGEDLYEMFKMLKLDQILSVTR
jgi:anti-anti-sigma factor